MCTTTLKQTGIGTALLVEYCLCVASHMLRMSVLGSADTSLVAFSYVEGILQWTDQGTMNQKECGGCCCGGDHMD